MRIKIPQVEAFRIPDHEDSVAVDQRSSEYSSTLRNALLQGGLSVLDPDVVLDADPEGYRKMTAETQIMAKIEKRVRSSACSDWLFTTTDARHRPLLPMFVAAFRHIQGFSRARKAMLANAILKGWGTARIEGEFVNCLMPGDTEVRRWWVPTVLTDVAKQRWRVTSARIGVNDGVEPNYEWAIQDVISHRWYKMDVPGAPPGLRRIDYAWCRYWETEEDIGYSHGLGRSLFHKWYMGTHNWVYALDGAESWSKGKIVIKTPNTLGGQGLPGDVQNQRSGSAIRQKLANEARKQTSRDVIVIDALQDYKVHGQPTSGYEATKWIAESIDEQYRELILGVLDKKDKIDPEVINDDKNTLDEALADVTCAFIEWNLPNWEALGADPDELRHSVRFFTKRVNSTDPEAIGKSMLIAQAMGVEVTKDDVYDGLSLTKPQAEDEVALAPPPGSPMTGAPPMAHAAAGMGAIQPDAPAETVVPTPPGPSPLAG